jgi:hypothetical protein
MVKQWTNTMIQIVNNRDIKIEDTKADLMHTLR